MGYFVWISETWYRTYKEPKLHDANKQRNKKRLKEPKKEKCYYHLTKLVRIVFQIKAERNLQIILSRLNYQGSFNTENDLLFF